MNKRIGLDSRAVIAFCDVVLLTLCLWVSRALQEQPIDAPFPWIYVAAPLIATPIFIRFGLYRAFLMYVSTPAFLAIGEAVTLQAALVGGVAYLYLAELPIRFVIDYWLLSLVVIGGSRIAMRSALRWYARSKQKPVRVAIFGGGSAGAHLAEVLQGGLEYLPVAFLDDKRTLHGNEIRGLRIFPRSKLGKLIKSYGVTHVLLALPSASSLRRREIVQFLEQYPVHVKTIPPLSELLLGQSEIREIREIDSTEILEREPVRPDQNLLRGCISGKTVLVTGAGGSIGSELSRQILALKPKKLVLFEHSEYALYSIERELRSLAFKSENETEILPVLGTVTDQAHLRSLFSSLQVETVYHAAAYKHVPLVETNPIPGIINNVFGTWHCARAAIATNVESFTLVSTDKAVRPTNVMGAAKRLAEQIIQGLSSESDTTRFSIVRFGNVVNSSGSVVPLFREQIRSGGPVTITHRDITRYFMTIPEAAQLVIQASAIGGSGAVFVLDMGEPVRVETLARRMITLSGLTVKDERNPNGDIEIVVTSLRPGEKLYEELVIGDDVTETPHPRIMRVREHHLPLKTLTDVLDRLQWACDDFDSPTVFRLLKEAVSEYRPSPWVIAGEQQVAPEAAATTKPSMAVEQPSAG